jgi:hypothetical protein
VGATDVRWAAGLNGSFEITDPGWLGQNAPKMVVSEKGGSLDTSEETVEITRQQPWSCTDAARPILHFSAVRRLVASVLDQP